METTPGHHDPTVRREQVHQDGGTTIIEREHHMTASMVPGELTAFGITERTM